MKIGQYSQVIDSPVISDLNNWYSSSLPIQLCTHFHNILLLKYEMRELDKKNWWDLDTVFWSECFAQLKTYQLLNEQT